MSYDCFEGKKGKQLETINLKINSHNIFASFTSENKTKQQSCKCRKSLSRLSYECLTTVVRHISRETYMQSHAEIGENQIQKE